MALVDELNTRKYWNDLCEYGTLLFNKTRSVRNAECLTNALSNNHMSEQIVEFLKENSDILSQSRYLQMFYSWALFHEGALLEARTELTKISDDRENPNYRDLKINLCIAIGDWNSLLSIVEYEYAQKDKRSANDLMRAAQLALHLGSL